MELSAPVMEILFLLSGALLYPTIILLIISVVWVFVTFGQMISEYSGRMRDMSGIRRAGKEAGGHLRQGDYGATAQSLQSIRANEEVRRFVRDLSGFLGDSRFPLEAEKLLQDYEFSISRKLEQLRILTRIAPMLGLMGTLIPLGPALMGLSSGNIQVLATNMVVAFSTTVLGLLVGGVAYAVLVVRRRWYYQDYSDMEYIAGVLA
ncbi:MAG TPA: MotA/TolQ/ExbB proton channel family protein [Methanoregulaceae archaeon]|jgi:biopolymer transport protein ExbB/TolQ|nr:MotA/TolQ/ExbB proton channel family protein [Methanoregulaceae archaeon]